MAPCFFLLIHCEGTRVHKIDAVNRMSRIGRVGGVFGWENVYAASPLLPPPRPSLLRHQLLHPGTAGTLTPSHSCLTQPVENKNINHKCVRVV